jgi:LysR family transcriptional regulator for metE and metH
MSNIESPKLDVRHLRMLVAVSELGSLTAAAAALHLTQSALSHQLREAEERVEAALFLRRNGRMVPAAAASALIKTAKTLLAELTQAESHAAPRHSAEAGVLRVSTACIACYQSWAEYALEFRERYPQVEVQVNLEAAGRPLEALLNGEIDLAVINGPPPGNKQFSSRLVIRDEMIAVFARTHALARKKYLEVEDFAGHEVLVYTPQSDSFLLCHLLAPQKIRAKRVFEMPLTEDIVRMASVSSAVALLPRWAFLPYLERYPAETRRVTQSGIHREWNAVVLKRSKSPAYFSKFIELMATKLNAIVGDPGTVVPAPKIARVGGRTAAPSVTC